MRDYIGESLLYLTGNKKPQKLRKVIEDLQAASGGGSGVTDGDKGDVVVSGSGSVWSVPDLSTKQNTITATTTADYYRGDKTFQPLSKDAVGLGNVDNTSDADKPISTATATALSGKSDTGHGHAIADTTGLQAALDGKQAAGSYAPATHTHVISDTTGLQGALDAKQPLTTVLTNTTASFTIAQETKLSGIETAATANSPDATLLNRSNHTGTQAISTVTGLQTALDGKQATGSYANSSHAHAQSDVTGLETALADRVKGTVRITVGTSAPVSPSVGDLWIDTN